MTRRLGIVLPSPLVRLDAPQAAVANVELYLKRDDLISQSIPGNKWRKLRLNLEGALEDGANTILTFGGAYSNHIRAVAAAGNILGLNTVGVIRGEEHIPVNWSLGAASQNGMTLTYMDRSLYRRKQDPDIIKELRARFGSFFLIPEGGSNARGVQGCTDIASEIADEFDWICVPCGTGGTLAGVSAGLRAGQRALGFSALKGEFMAEEVRSLQQEAFGRVYENWSVNYDYHFGGFARMKPQLRDFLVSFEQSYGIALEWIYVAKMMAGVLDLIDGGFFPPGSKIVALVTGPAEPVIP